tara:strand:- start:26106 stop:27053 length:948 start_codon:yes stop_codon:yes gene_type:complete
MKNSIFKIGILAMITAFGSCEKENDSYNENAEKQNTEVSITDAPIDNANVSGAFVTITDVKIDGISIEGFSTTTVDLLKLQNGKKLALGNIDLNVGAVSNVVLVLDYAQDQNGNAPGCYIATANGLKHELKSSVNEIKINDQTEIITSTANEIVIDFDLRKTIIENNSTSTNQFDFVSSTELSSGLRLINNVEAGSISGTVSDNENTSERIVVYAYEKGTYSSSEAEAKGTSGVTFANAVTSTMVNSFSGAYKVNFLKEGDYEFHFASYSDTDGDGKFEFNSMLRVESLTDIQLNTITISSKINLSLNVNVTGRL